MPRGYAKTAKLYIASLGNWTARVPATTPVRAWKEAVLCFAASEQGRKLLELARFEDKVTPGLQLRLANQAERADFAAKHRADLQPETLKAWGLT